MSHDRVRKIVQEEGRSARNLIAYNVPVVDETAAKPCEYMLLLLPVLCGDEFHINSFGKCCISEHV